MKLKKAHIDMLKQQIKRGECEEHPLCNSKLSLDAVIAWTVATKLQRLLDLRRPHISTVREVWHQVVGFKAVLESDEYRYADVLQFLEDTLCVLPARIHYTILGGAQ